jgi:hypothetical protein
MNFIETKTMFMKKIYTSVFVLSFWLSGCSKDFLKSYDERIIGTWQITDVNKVGIGGSTGNLPFRQGSFSFMNDGTMTFTNASGETFKGGGTFRKKLWMTIMVLFTIVYKSQL